MGVEQIWQQYKENGLKVVWVVGEDENKQLPSWDWIQNFIDGKGVTFKVVRDFEFLQTYGVVEPHSNALPHQYILDAKTMELVHASGGVNDESEQKLVELMND